MVSSPNTDFTYHCYLKKDGWGKLYSSFSNSSFFSHWKKTTEVLFSIVHPFSSEKDKKKVCVYEIPSFEY